MATNHKRWYSEVPKGRVQMLTYGCSFNFTKEKGVVCDKGLNEVTINTIRWESKQNLVEFYFGETIRQQLSNGKSLELNEVDYLSGLKFTVNTDGKFANVINLSELVDAMVAKDLVKQSIVPDHTRAMEMLNEPDSKIGEIVDLSRLRDRYSRSVSNAAQNIWWEISEAFLPKTAESSKNSEEFDHWDEKCVRFSRDSKAQQKKLLEKFVENLKNIVGKGDYHSEDVVSFAEIVSPNFWKSLRWNCKIESIVEVNSHRPHVTTCLNMREGKFLIQKKKYSNMLFSAMKRIFLWPELTRDLQKELLDREICGYWEECQGIFGSYSEKFSKNNPQLRMFVQDVFENFGADNNNRIDQKEAEAVLNEVLGHTPGDSEMESIFDNKKRIDVNQFINCITSNTSLFNIVISHVDVLDMQKPMLAGFLSKKGGVLRKTWSKKFFIFDRVLGLLYYYKNFPVSTSDEPSGIISIFQIKECNVINRNPFVFALTIRRSAEKEKVYQFTNDDDEAMQKWVHAINSSIWERHNLYEKDIRLQILAFRVNALLDHMLDQITGNNNYLEKYT